MKKYNDLPKEVRDNDMAILKALFEAVNDYAETKNEMFEDYKERFSESIAYAICEVGDAMVNFHNDPDSICIGSLEDFHLSFEKMMKLRESLWPREHRQKLREDDED